jgi:hypothetical protein
LARGTQLGDGHELVVVGGEPECDLLQRITDVETVLAQDAQVVNPRGDSACEFPGRTRPEVVERRAVDGDGPHAAVVPGGPHGDGGDLGDGRTRVTTQRRGQGIGAEVHGQQRAPLGGQIGDQRQQRLGGCGVVTARGTDVERHRDQFEEHALEHPVQFVDPDAVGADPQHQRADTLCQRGKHSTVAVADRDLPGRRERLGDLPAGLHVAQRVAASDEGPLTGQRLLGHRVERGVERPDREAVVGG